MANSLRQIADNLDKLSPLGMAILWVLVWMFVIAICVAMILTVVERTFYKREAERLGRKLELSDLDKDRYKRWWRESVEKTSRFREEKTK